MEKFISRIIDEIDATDFDQLRKRCYIFPTKRGGLYFESFLKNKYSDKVFWAPKVLSIKEFVEFMVGRKITDSMTLLFELFDVYKVMDPEGNLETFEKFYPWGEILLKDFDEIDKYLVDAEKLFQNIYDIKEMEARFGMEDPAIEAINKFRSIISGQDKTELLKKFLTVWKMVGKIYQSFKQNLSDKKMAFEGMLYKELLNLFTTQTDKSNYTEFHFCGFNALSNAEEAIFDVLLKQKRATLYWDADPVYMDTRYWHEAGWFLKKYKQKWEDNENCKWFYCNMLKEQKNIQIIGAVQNMAQVKITSELLKQNFTEANIEKADTAIVLANEQLLIPALYALPKNVKETNVTMGYPAFQSSISTLLQKILDLQIIRSGKGDKSYFRSEELIAVLKNSNIQILCKKNLGEINHWILNNRRNFISLADIKEKVKNELTLSIFEPKKKASEMMHFLVSFSRNLFQAFHRNYKNKKEQNIEDPELKNELDFLYNFIEHLSAFGGRIERNLNRLNLSLLRKMLTESLRSLKVPFNGDSLRGLQVMGFLETRTLDFENLYLLSANETHLPAERKLNSFVPYSVRKAFQMPTFEEQDAIYSYHFYRLLQRAKNVFLLYDTEPKSGLNVGEQSRFLKQLLRLVKDERNQSAINISEIKYDNTAPKEQKAKEIISIEKTPEVLDKMNIYLLNNNGNVSGEETKSFSPTSLSNYIECSLRFYFN